MSEAMQQTRSLAALQPNWWLQPFADIMALPPLAMPTLNFTKGPLRCLVCERPYKRQRRGLQIASLSRIRLLLFVRKGRCSGSERTSGIRTNIDLSKRHLSSRILWRIPSLSTTTDRLMRR
jgi:hypothetical protein